MNPLLCWLLCASLASGAFAQTSDVPAKTIKIVFWNIQWFPGRGPNPTAGKEARQIASVHRDLMKIDADLLGIEEVRDFANEIGRAHV